MNATEIRYPCRGCSATITVAPGEVMPEECGHCDEEVSDVAAMIFDGVEPETIGERLATAHRRITDARVARDRLVRQAFEDGVGAYAIADHLGVTPKAVYMILNGDWRR